jgi:hypothetical protein
MFFLLWPPPRSTLPCPEASHQSIMTKQNKTKQSKTKQNKTKQMKTQSLAQSGGVPQWKDEKMVTRQLCESGVSGWLSSSGPLGRARLAACGHPQTGPKRQRSNQ